MAPRPTSLPVPVVVSKGYGIPSFVGPGTLVFAISFSGDTEETIEAANAAAMAGGRMVVVAAGGELGRLAADWGAPHVVLPDDIPMPRAGIGAVALARVGLRQRHLAQRAAVERGAEAAR